MTPSKASTGPPNWKMSPTNPPRATAWVSPCQVKL